MTSTGEDVGLGVGGFGRGLLFRFRENGWLRVQCYDCMKLRLRANGRNNSQHYWRNNVGSCCLHVGSGVQTDATTPNIVGATMLGVVAYMLAVVCKRMQQLSTMLRPAEHRGKDTTHKSL